MGAGVFDNTEEMCSVCEQRLAMRAYELVYPIENQMPMKTEFSVEKDTIVKFSVSRVKPMPDTQEIKWILNGKVISNISDVVKIELKADQGYELVYSLRDTTSFIREDPPYGQFPYREHRWRINPDIPLRTDSYTFVWEESDHKCEAGHRYEAEKSSFYEEESEVIQFGGASELEYLQVSSLNKGVEWQIEVEENGVYSLNFSVASRIPELVSCDLYLNDELYFENLDFPRTVPLYTGWMGRIVNIYLEKGQSTISLRSEDDVSINIDYLWVPEEPKKRTEEPEIAYEAGPTQVANKGLKKKAKQIKPHKIKSANMVMWLDASEIELTEITPYRNWNEKISETKGPDVKFKPGVINGKGLAGFDIVWLSSLATPVKEFQTIIMVYRESDMSFKGTSPFRDLDEYIGRADHGESALLDRDVSELTKEGRVFLNGYQVDPFNTSAPEGIRLLNVELSEKVTKEFKYTQGYWEGDLAEMMIFDGKLSEKDRKRIEKYLIDKWLVRELGN